MSKQTISDHEVEKRISIFMYSYRALECHSVVDFYLSALCIIKF